MYNFKDKQGDLPITNSRFFPSFFAYFSSFQVSPISDNGSGPSRHTQGFDLLNQRTPFHPQSLANIVSLRKRKEKQKHNPNTRFPWAACRPNSYTNPPSCVAGSLRTTRWTRWTWNITLWLRPEKHAHAGRELEEDQTKFKFSLKKIRRNGFFFCWSAIVNEGFLEENESWIFFKIFFQKFSKKI